MRLFVNSLSLFLVVACSLAGATPESLATERALSLAKLMATHRYDPVWKKDIVPEYFHPESNDSGISSPRPNFMPLIPSETGQFIFTKISVGKVLIGRDSHFLSGTQDIACVELVFNVVASANNKVQILPQPIQKSKYFVMTIDSSDGKWKYLDSIPLTSYFFEPAYFLDNWSRILGKQFAENIKEVEPGLRKLSSENQ